MCGIEVCRLTSVYTFERIYAYSEQRPDEASRFPVSHFIPLRQGLSQSGDRLATSMPQQHSLSVPSIGVIAEHSHTQIFFTLVLEI